MSHFYATIKGSHGEATRQGTARSGLYSNIAGWSGCISVSVWEDRDQDYYRVSLTPWHGSGGESRVIAGGPLDSSVLEFITCGAALGSRDLKMLSLLRTMVDSWPQVFADPDDEQEMNGGDAVDAMCDYVREAKALLDKYKG